MGYLVLNLIPPLLDFCFFFQNLRDTLLCCWTEAPALEKKQEAKCTDIIQFKPLPLSLHLKFEKVSQEEDLFIKLSALHDAVVGYMTVLRNICCFISKILFWHF